MNEYLKNSISNGELIIFIGAGASKSSLNNKNEPVPDGVQLSKIICKKIGMEYGGEALSKVYAAGVSVLGPVKLVKLLEEELKFCQPSDDYKALARLPVKRIYTLNIDDCIESAIRSDPINNRVDVKNRNDFVTEYSYLNKVKTLVKLNGDIHRPDLGFIFSAQEYARNMTKTINWYSELAKDMHTYTFLFVGTKLDEPLLEYYLELFKKNNNVSTSTRSYVLTPSATEIEKLSLKQNNLEHISGKLSDFINYMDEQFSGKMPTNEDIARNINPYMIQNDRLINIQLASYITPVSLKNLMSRQSNDASLSTVRDFYRGFKPTWEDIIDDVPATLKKTNDFMAAAFGEKNKPCELFVIFGVAGSGKSTALKQIALHLSNQKDRTVYFLDNVYESLTAVLAYLDSIHDQPYYICIDRIINNRYQELAEIINKRNTKAIFIITENTTLWERKAKAVLGELTTRYLNISTIESEDVDNILNKIEEFGNWTILGSMSLSNRRKELADKASKQLLIGLLEATSGYGYQEIIIKDFNSINSVDERNLLLLASIPALENLSCNEESIGRALSYLNPDFKSSVAYLTSNLKGILKYNNGEVTTRHRIYSERIFDINENSKFKEPLLIAYVNAFIKYQFPVVRNISTKEGNIYKHLVNFRFLIKFLNNDEDTILKLYDRFEKSLENEGLFLLQYGLALRHFKHALQSYEKLKLAASAFQSSPHIEHALAHQKLILASEPNHSLNRDNLFNEAKETLNRLSKVEAGHFKNDSYPIVTLSKGHINYLIYLNKVDDAKKVAADYFNVLESHTEYKSDPYLKKIATDLMNYNLFNTWKFDF